MINFTSKISQLSEYIMRQTNIQSKVDLTLLLVILLFSLLWFIILPFLFKYKKIKKYYILLYVLFLLCSVGFIIYDGIFNWMVEGLKSLDKQGYITEPISSDAEISEYNNMASSIHSFFA